MTETPGRPSNPTPEPRSNETTDTTEATPTATSEPTTEPTPTATGEPTTEPMTAATSAPTAEMTGTAPTTAESRAGRRWPKNRPNRIAASVAIVAGAFAVVAVIFTSGVVVGAHADGEGEHLDRWGNHSEMSAGREHTPTGQIWIIPGGETARGHDGYIIVGSGADFHNGS
jgi:hypothetical protein